MKTEIKDLMEEIKNGKTVYISNYTHCWKITQKTVDRFLAVGRDILKQNGKSLYMSSGRGYVCVDGCSIKVVA